MPKPKMIDLGYMMNSETDAPSKVKRSKHYPSIWLDAGIPLPLSLEDVGKTLNITGTIHITGMDESTNEDRTKKEYRFELRSMAIDNRRSRLKGALNKVARR